MPALNLDPKAPAGDPAGHAEGGNTDQPDPATVPLVAAEDHNQPGGYETTQPADGDDQPARRPAAKQQASGKGK